MERVAILMLRTIFYSLEDLTMRDVKEIRDFLGYVGSDEDIQKCINSRSNMV
jgi:hypothetical protein